jgi:hypothetical protein
MRNNFNATPLTRMLALMRMEYYMIACCPYPKSEHL